MPWIVLNHDIYHISELPNPMQHLLKHVSEDYILPILLLEFPPLLQTDCSLLLSKMEHVLEDLSLVSSVPLHLRPVFVAKGT